MQGFLVAPPAHTHQSDSIERGGDYDSWLIAQYEERRTAAAAAAAAVDESQERDISRPTASQTGARGGDAAPLANNEAKRN
eukprot:SAG31_NODE_19577_length_598_cov_0.815631_1_plen_80_part_01